MKSNILSITPLQAWEILKDCYTTHETVMLHGNRGIGKTELAEQFANQVVGGPCYKLLLTQIEPPDIRGLVYPDEQTMTTRWLRPEFLPITGPGVILIDELTAAETRIQKSAYQLIRERCVGEYKVPNDVFIIAAGNTGDDGAIIHQLDAPAADRMVHLRIVADPKSWIRWAEANQIATPVIAYIRHRPDDLDGTQQQQQQEHLLGPSPRGWARLAKFIAAKVPRERLQVIAAGIVGEHVAASFIAVYDDILASSTIEDILAMPPGQRWKKIPTTVSGIYNLCYSLRAMVVDHESMVQAVQVCSAFMHVPVKILPLAEMQTLAMELVMDKADSVNKTLLYDLTRTQEYIDYAKRREGK